VRRLPGLLPTILVGVGSLSLAPATARAQETAGQVFAAMRTDSTAWQHVLEYVVGALSVTLVSAAGDPTPQPWELQVPSDDPQRQLLLTQLRTILRARQTMPADTLVRSLKLGPLIVARDTARVDIDFEETRKCPGGTRTTGFGWMTTVLVSRDPRQKFWGQAFSRTTQHGDRVGC
jgi:hypothetical protein